MASKDRDLRVGETVYWVRWNRTPSGFRGKTVLYSRVEILALKEHTVQVDERQFVPYGSIHKLDSFKTLDVRDQKGRLRTVIPDSIKLRTSGGGDYHVEGVDFNLGYTVSLFRASGKGAVTTCRSYIYASKPDQREIEAREKEESRRREEESKREVRLREKAREEKYALDRIKSEEIFQSYLNREGTDALSNLRKAFLATSPKNILLEAENCIAAGIDADTVMREGMVKGFLRALECLYLQYQENLVYFPEIVLYNRLVFQNHIATFKNRYYPAPLPSLLNNPVLLFSLAVGSALGHFYEGILNILEIPAISTSDGYDLQKVEKLIDENGIRTILCFLVDYKYITNDRSNELTLNLIQRMHPRLDLEILVTAGSSNPFLSGLQKLNAKNITLCPSPLEVIHRFHSARIDGKQDANPEYRSIPPVA